MPDVGVLNLEIHDNSQTAGDGLRHLGDALRYVKTQTEGFKLTGVSGPLNKFASAISGNAKVLSNVGSFLNAMKEYQKVFKDAENVKFNAAPIEAIKNALGDGIKIGQAGTQLNKIREALGGDWNTVNSGSIKTVMEDIATGSKSIAGANLGSTANNVSKAAKALMEYADASRQIKSALGGATGGASLDSLAGKKSFMKLNTQLFAEKGDFEEVKSTTSQITETYKEYAGQINGIHIDFSKFDPSNLNKAALGMTMEQFRNGGAELAKYRDIVRDAENELMRMKPNADLERFNENAPKSIILYDDTIKNNLQNTWEELARKEAEATAEAQKYFDTQKQLGWGTGSIKPLVEMDNVYGESLRGWYGENQRMDIIEQVAKNTGIQKEEIIKQLSEISEGYVNLGNTAQTVAHGGMASFKNEIDEICNSALDGESKLELLRRKSEIIEGQIDKREDYLLKRGRDPFDDKTIVNYKLQLASINEQMDHLISKSRAAQEATRFEAMKNSADNLQRSYGTDMVNDMTKNYESVELMEMKLAGMKQALADDINQNKVDTQQIAERSMAIQQLTEKIEHLKQAQEEATKSTTSFGDVWKGLGSAMKAIFPTISGLLGRFKQIVKYRMIRSVIKHITSGFSEGIQNVYQYSKAIGGTFAPAMDSAATAIQQMKNSLGAALAPAIQALIPYLQTVVNWFINLVNYANQFFALLNGQKTWTRALPATTEAFNKQKKAAKGASAAVKDLLADWDELNIIQSQTGGGGGAGATTAEDYLKMFEEVSRFDNKVKDIVNFVKDNFGEILGTVGTIKLGMAAWRLSGALTESLPILSKIAMGFSAGATIALSVALTDLTGKMYTDTGEAGWLIADALSGAVGATVAYGIAEKIAVGSGIYTSAFTLILDGAINIKNAVEAAEQEKEAQGWALAILGSVEAGIGTALGLAGFGFGTAISVSGGIATGGLLLLLTAHAMLEAKKSASYRNMAIAAFNSTGENGINPEEYIKALQTRLDEITKDSHLVVEASLGLDEHTENYQNAIESIKVLNALASNSGLTQEDADAFKNAWDTVINELRDISKIEYKTIYAGLDEAIANGSESISKATLELRKQARIMESAMNGAISGLQKDLESIQNEIFAGNDDPELIKKYKKIYSVLAKETNDGIVELKKALDEGSNFDFGNENGVTAALSFLDGLNSETIQPTIDSINAQYDAEMESIKKAQEMLEDFHELGYINNDTYKSLSQFYTDTIDQLTLRHTEQGEEISQYTSGAANSIIKQLIEGYYSLDQSDERALQTYVETVISPITAKIKEIFGDDTNIEWGGIGEIISKKYEEGLKEINFINLAESIPDISGMDAQEIADTINDRLYWALATFHGDLGDQAYSLGMPLWSIIPEDMRKNLEMQMDELFGEDLTKQILAKFNETPISAEEIEATKLMQSMDFSELIKGAILGVESGKKALDVGIPINIKPELFSIDVTKFTEEIERSIREALQDDSKLDMYEFDALDTKYGWDIVEPIYNKMLENGMNPDGTFGRTLPTGAKLTASAGVTSGVRWNTSADYGVNVSGDESIKTEPKDSQQEVSNTAAGVKQGNAEVVSELQTLVQRMEQLIAKNWTVNVSPTTGFARTAAAAGVLLGKVTGDV